MEDLVLSLHSYFILLQNEGNVHGEGYRVNGDCPHPDVHLAMQSIR